jgi:hypothetical protein
MIVGLTHSSEGIAILDSNRVKGKISTGYAPMEGPNKGNHPVAAGHFRVMQSVVETLKFGGKEEQVTKWKLWTAMQERLEQLSGSKMPTVLSFLSMYKTPEEMWDSNLSKFGLTGLQCRSNGYGTVAKMLKMKGDERLWVEREFGDFKGCMHEKCPDFISGACSVQGSLKIFPVFDPSTEPYRFDTKSVYVIKEIESMLNKIYNMSKISHSCLEKEHGRSLPFDGLFGFKFHLFHKKKRIGGKEVFVTDLVPSDETSLAIMGPIKRVLSKNHKAALTGGPQTSVLSIAADTHDNSPSDDFKMISSPTDEVYDESIIAQATVETAAQEKAAAEKAKAEMMDKLLEIGG